jgi:DMSO reductase family type II enzyme chaperone
MSERTVSGRHAETTADLRCMAFAALSELAASPHEIDPRPALREKIGLASNLAYGEALDELLAEFVDADLDVLKKEYSGLFEVGSGGPPVPIREDLQTGQRAGTREELIRFYNFFNYKLDEKFAWAPDHLSVLLEFMHFLCFSEATAETEVLSYQLAQVDFTERHLIRWVPDLVSSVDQVSPDSRYARVMHVVRDFLQADFAFQQGTVVSSPQIPDALT